MRRVALVMFNSAAHNKPSLIRGLLGSVLPHLYRETQIRKDLIREVSGLPEELERSGGCASTESKPNVEPIRSTTSFFWGLVYVAVFLTEMIEEDLHKDRRSPPPLQP